VAQGTVVHHRPPWRTGRSSGHLFRGAARWAVGL